MYQHFSKKLSKFCFFLIGHLPPPSLPQEIPVPFVGRVWVIIIWNCTLILFDILQLQYLICDGRHVLVIHFIQRLESVARVLKI